MGKVSRCLQNHLQIFHRILYGKFPVKAVLSPITLQLAAKPHFLRLPVRCIIALDIGLHQIIVKFQALHRLPDNFRFLLLLLLLFHGKHSLHFLYAALFAKKMNVSVNPYLAVTEEKRLLQTNALDSVRIVYLQNEADCMRAGNHIIITQNSHCVFPAHLGEIHIII